MFDIDTLDAELTHDVLALRQPIPNRVLHIDADFLCYMCTFADDVPFQIMYYNLVSMVNRFKAMALADSVVLHLTASGSSKNGRYDIALLKPYQGNRTNERKPEFLETMRLKVAQGKDFPAHYWKDIEADDGMSIMQWKDIRSGNENLSVILSKDKDLNIVAGWHLTWEKDDDCSLVYHDWLGTLTLVEKSSKKCIGTGAKFFWAQMLMGDPADNISGIPKCGAIKAYNLLVNATSHRDMCAIVMDEYKKLSFKDYHGNNIEWTDAFMSEAQLLWMNREAGATQFESFTKYLINIGREEL